jgi:hypothetical protein
VKIFIVSRRELPSIRQASAMFSADIAPCFQALRILEEGRRVDELIFRRLLSGSSPPDAVAIPVL